MRFGLLSTLFILALVVPGCSSSGGTGVDAADVVDASANDSGLPAAVDYDGDGVPDVIDICPVTPQGPTPDPIRVGCPAAEVLRYSNGDASTYTLQGATRAGSMYSNVVTSSGYSTVAAPFDVVGRPVAADWLDVVEALVVVNVDISGPATPPGGGCVDNYSDKAPDGSCVARYVSAQLLNAAGGVLSTVAVPMPTGWNKGDYTLLLPAFSSVRLPAGDRHFSVQLVLRGYIHNLTINTVSARIEARASR